MLNITNRENTATHFYFIFNTNWETNHATVVDQAQFGNLRFKSRVYMAWNRTLNITIVTSSRGKTVLIKQALPASSKFFPWTVEEMTTSSLSLLKSKPASITLLAQNSDSLGCLMKLCKIFEPNWYGGTKLPKIRSSGNWLVM